MKAFNSTLQQLIEGTKVFSVPLYQRRYSWTQQNWKTYWRSLLEQYDIALASPSSGPTNFIGSFVLAPAPGAATAPTRYIVVDGQQRLLTTMALLAAIRDASSELAEDEGTRSAAVAKYNTLYLHNTFETEEDKQLRLLPTQQDRADYREAVGRTPARPVGLIGEAYEYFRSARCLRGTDLNGDPLDLNKIAETLLSRFTLVEITTESGDNVHRIFQTLNSAGVRLKQVDLLRNHFFMLLPSRGEELYSKYWREMELTLGEQQLDRFFWAELVRTNARVSRTDVYAAMQTELEPIEADEPAVERKLQEFFQDSKSYSRIIQEEADTAVAIENRLEFLRSWGSETARPLILETLVQLRDGQIGTDEAAATLKVLESFLVRRMLAGIPTNNLNRIFSSLTPTLARRSLSATAVADSLSEGQKYWPSDAQLREALLTRPFYFSGQAHQRRLVLTAIEQARAGKEAGTLSPDLQIEHVLPQKPSTESLSALDEDPDRAAALHEQLVHTIGNVTLTGYNPELGNRDYEDKRNIYRESAIRITREIADTYEAWGANEIRQRSADLADSIIHLWPGPSVSSIDISTMGEADLEEALILLPPSGWTSPGELVELSGLSTAEVSGTLSTLAESLQSRVSVAGGGRNPASFFPAGKMRALIALSQNADEELD